MLRNVYGFIKSPTLERVAVFILEGKRPYDSYYDFLM
jgi:hypothetical protein